MAEYGKQAEVVEDVDTDVVLMSLAWREFLDKTAQSALLILFAKLIAAWVIVAAWSVPVSSRWLWGFIPYAGLRTTAVEFRTLAGWSTAATAIVAMLWTGLHLIRTREASGRLWGAAAALPMAGLTAIFEWYRRFDGAHLLPGSWLMWILLAVTAASVLVLGFVETSDTRAPVRPLPRRSPVG